MEAGWLLFDGECAPCTRVARWLSPLLSRRNFRIAALQEEWVGARLGLTGEALLSEMRVLTDAGRSIGGADAVVFLAGKFWWSWPLVAFAWIPGGTSVLRFAYRWIASHRGCGSTVCPSGQGASRRG